MRLLFAARSPALGVSRLIRQDMTETGRCRKMVCEA
jgi:hypothetical protein